MKRHLLTALLSLATLAAAQTAPSPTPTTPTAPSAPVTAPAAPVTPAAPAPAATQAPRTATDSTVIATVGSTDYTLGEFNRLFKQAVARSANAQGLPYSDDLAAEFASYQSDFLDTFVRQKAILQLARAAGFKPDTAAIDAQLKSAQDQFKTQPELNTALQGSGFADEADYHASLEDQQTVTAYLQSVRSRFKFSDSLVASFYGLNKASFNAGAQACVKHILVPTEGEAQQIAKDLAAGGDFAAIAKAKSKDPGSAEKGGDLGCLAPGDTVPEFDKASFQGPLNAVQVVKSQFGYHVLIVTKRTAAGVQPLSAVSDQIREQLGNEAAQKYLESQVAKVPKTLYKDRLPAPVAAPAAKPAPATPARPAVNPSSPAPTPAAPAPTTPAPTPKK